MVGPGPDGAGPGRGSLWDPPSCTRRKPTAWRGTTWSRGSGCPTGTSIPPSPIAPGGESWSVFVARALSAVRELLRQHPGELVVAAVHAGVIEATMIDFLGVPPEVYRAGWVRMCHASMTEWEWVPSADRFSLSCCASTTPAGCRAWRREGGSGVAEEGASQSLGRAGKPGILDRLTQRFLAAARSCTRMAAKPSKCGMVKNSSAPVASRASLSARSAVQSARIGPRAGPCRRSA